jgi:hypothetical protein
MANVKPESVRDDPSQDKIVQDLKAENEMKAIESEMESESQKTKVKHLLEKIRFLNQKWKMKEQEWIEKTKDLTIKLEAADNLISDHIELIENQEERIDKLKIEVDRLKINQESKSNLSVEAVKTLGMENDNLLIEGTQNKKPKKPKIISSSEFQTTKNVALTSTQIKTERQSKNCDENLPSPKNQIKVKNKEDMESKNCDENLSLAKNQILVENKEDKDSTELHQQTTRSMNENCNYDPKVFSQMLPKAKSVRRKCKSNKKLADVKTLGDVKALGDLNNIFPAHKYSDKTLTRDEVLDLARTFKSQYEFGLTLILPSPKGIYVFGSTDSGLDRTWLGNLDPFIWKYMNINALKSKQTKNQDTVVVTKWNAFNTKDKVTTNLWTKTAFYIKSCKKYIVQYQGNPMLGKRRDHMAMGDYEMKNCPKANVS